jgi:hypothetical protein
MSTSHSSNIVKWLGLIVCLSGTVGAGAAISNSAGGSWRPAWFMFGFELVVVLAGVMTWMLGRGRFGSAAVGLICAAGTILIASGFGFLGAGKVLWGFSLMPHLAARVLISAAIAAMAVRIHLSSDPGNLRLAARGVVLGLPVLVVGGAAWAARAQITSWPTVLLLVLAMVGFVVATGLIAASADCLIRAFSSKPAQAM